MLDYALDVGSPFEPCPFMKRFSIKYSYKEKIGKKKLNTDRLAFHSMQKKQKKQKVKAQQ